VPAAAGCWRRCEWQHLKYLIILDAFAVEPKWTLAQVLRGTLHCMLAA
jgi:hypothetical protein